ncbi:hypothetical protein EYC80_003060 [Monilinia laxa]|uniref:Uncharacterized protein n=1 Tax=Monilinia laxa TaxID=61186 RepID=A0A5N6KCJ5_MONLA|nr:hypothetical protein EYC80_003060 [Monilinia laxa]
MGVVRQAQRLHSGRLTFFPELKGLNGGYAQIRRRESVGCAFLIPAELPLPALAALSFLVFVLQSYKWFP